MSAPSLSSKSPSPVQSNIADGVPRAASSARRNTPIELAPQPGGPTAPVQFITYLSSVKLDGDDFKRHIEGNYVTEIVPSPDGNWVFFKEQHKLYVAPFPKVGKTVKLSSTETGVPVKNVSTASGDWLAWSPDSKTVQWTLGENFYEQSIDNVFRSLTKEEKPPAPRQTNTNRK